MRGERGDEYIDEGPCSTRGGLDQRDAHVSRVHLGYDAAYHPSLLASVQVEGRCVNAIEEDVEDLPATTGCPRLPAMKLGYQHVASAPGDLPR